ncbi:MAG: CGGC domain-containing protein [Candidatus Cloacimonetes bacterium]|nr:CGGC domain-containing protein [Candidatus Cloacimonadota bacterium]
MKKVGIIICGRYQNCGGGKCLMSLREHEGGFSLYKEELQLVGYSYCGGCPGGNIEYVPEEMINNGAEVIHLATGMIVGYPPCPRLFKFKEFIESYYETKVVLGTHPVPMKYLKTHKKLSFWNDKIKNEMEYLFPEDKIMIKYN